MPKITKTAKFRRTPSSATTKSKLSTIVDNTKKTESNLLKRGEVGNQIIDDQQQKQKQQQQQQLSILTPPQVKDNAIPKSKETKNKNNKDRIEISEKKIADDEKKEESNAQTSSSSSLLSKGQRKRLAKREQYVKKQQMILSSLQLKHKDEQTKRIDGLDALKDALLATMEDSTDNKLSSTTADGNKTNENSININLSGKATVTKKLVIQQELVQLDLVRQHPQFINNPFQTIQEHLQNTFSKEIEQQKVIQVQYEQQRQHDDVQKKVLKKEKQNQISFIQKKKKKSKFKATRSKSR
jgi:Ribosome biogenesis protein SLX9